jgi:hypothetical protein
MMVTMLARPMLAFVPLLLLSLFVPLVAEPASAVAEEDGKGDVEEDGEEVSE